MDTHGQLGLFSVNSPKPSPVMKNASIKTLLMEICFNEASGEHLERTIEILGQEVGKLRGEIKNFSLNDDRPWFDRNFVALDVETTGLDAASCRVIELAIVPFNSNAPAFSQLFSVGEPLPHEITQITGITDAMLKGQPNFSEKVPQIMEQLKKADFIVAYNAKFDRPFLESELARANVSLPDIPWVDPYIFICELDRYKKGKKLSDAAQRWGISLDNAHRAQADARAAGELMQKISDKIEAQDLSELLAQQKILTWKQAHSMAEYKKANTWSINR